MLPALPLSNLTDVRELGARAPIILGEGWRDPSCHIERRSA